MARKDLPPISPDSPASLVMTSGSTGLPKRNTQTHGNLVGYVRFYRDVTEITHEDCFALITRCSFFASTSAVFGSLLSGASLVPVDVRALGLAGALQVLRHHRVSMYHSVPTLFRRIAKHAPQSSGAAILPNLRIVRLGGEAVRCEDLALLGRLNPDAQLFVVLSASETGPIAYDLYRPSQYEGDGRLLLAMRKRVPGVVLSVAEAEDDAVADVTAHTANQAVKDSKIGRVCVRSSNLSQEAAASGAPEERGSTYFTGDIGQIDPDGGLYVLGRADDRVKIAGAFASLTEIEAALCNVPGVREGAVRAEPNREGELHLIAWFAPEDATKMLEPELIRRALAQSLASHMIPSVLIQQDSLPTTATGKIDRKQLTVPTPDPSALPAAAQDDRIRDPMLRVLTAICASVLDKSSISPGQNFFEAGGTSVQALELLLRIEQRFGVALPISALIESRTIRELSQALAEGSLRNADSDFITLRPAQGDGETPLFCIHALDGWVFSMRRLAEKLSGDHAILGLQSPGLRGRLHPLRSLESMAAHYVDAIRSQQHRGPYRLCGYCMGGLIAVEIAQQLAAQGETVSELTLIDASMPRPSKRMTGPRALWQATMRRPWLAMQLMMRPASKRQRLILSTRYRRRIEKIHQAALHAYQPSRLAAAPLFVMCKEGEPQRTKLGHRLAELLHPDSKVIIVPGDHLSCMAEPGVDQIAAAMNR